MIVNFLPQTLAAAAAESAAKLCTQIGGDHVFRGECSKRLGKDFTR